MPKLAKSLNDSPEDLASSLNLELLTRSVSENLNLLDILSLEIIFRIFDYLEVNEVRKLRQVDKTFSTIDLQYYFKHRLYQEFPVWKTFYLEQGDKEFDWYHELKKVYRQEEIQKAHYTEHEIDIINRLRSGQPEDLAWLAEQTEINGTLTKNFSAEILMKLFTPRAPSFRLRNWNFPKSTNDFLYDVAIKGLSEPKDAKEQEKRNELLLIYKIFFNQDIPQIEKDMLKRRYIFGEQIYSSFYSLAISQGRLDVIESIHNAYPNEFTKQTKAMLNTACESQQLEIAIYLLERAKLEGDEAFKKTLFEVFAFIIDHQLSETAIFRQLFQKYHSYVDLQNLSAHGIRRDISLSTLKHILPPLTPNNVQWQKDMINIALAYQRDNLAAALLEKNFACPDDVLHQFAGAGFLESARVILSGKTSVQNISVDCQNNEKETPLLYAISHHRNRMVEFLLKSGANVANSYERTNGNTVTPLSAALSSRADSIGVILINWGAPFKAADFHDAISYGMIDTAKAMLEKNPTLANTVNSKGEHVITQVLESLSSMELSHTRSLQKQYTDFLNVLLSKLPEDTDKIQFKNNIATLLQVAFVFRNQELAYFAVKRPTLSAYLSDTPLLTAAYYGMHNVVMHLLTQHENYLEQLDKEKNNILIYAAYKGDTKLLKMLHDYVNTKNRGGINRIDIKNKYGKSALYIAASNKNDIAVRCLLAMDAKLIPNSLSVAQDLNSDTRNLLALQSYIQTRDAQGEYRTPRLALIKIFGDSAKKKVFTKEQKLEAARFFKGLYFTNNPQEYCNNYLDKLDMFQAILSEGRLGKIVSALGGCNLMRYKPAPPLAP